MAHYIGVFRIGRDAELRFTQGGDPVASLALACNYGKKGEDGNRPSQWIDASLWGKRAEAMVPHLTKGGMIYAVIEDVHIETYEGKNGKGSKLVGKIMEIEFAGGKRPEAKQSTASDYAAAKSGSRPVPKSSFDDLPDDLPF